MSKGDDARRGLFGNMTSEGWEREKRTTRPRLPPQHDWPAGPSTLSPLPPFHRLPPLPLFARARALSHPRFFPLPSSRSARAAITVSRWISPLPSFFSARSDRRISRQLFHFPCDTFSSPLFSSVEEESRFLSSFLPELYRKRGYDYLGETCRIFEYEWNRWFGYRREKERGGRNLPTLKTDNNWLERCLLIRCRCHVSLEILFVFGRIGEFGRGGDFKKRIGPRVVKTANPIPVFSKRVTELFLPTNSTRSFVRKNGEERAWRWPLGNSQLIYQTVGRCKIFSRASTWSTTSEVLARLEIEWTESCRNGHISWRSIEQKWRQIFFFFFFKESVYHVHSFFRLSIDGVLNDGRAKVTNRCCLHVF